MHAWTGDTSDDLLKQGLSRDWLNIWLIPSSTAAVLQFVISTDTVKIHHIPSFFTLQDFLVLHNKNEFFAIWLQGNDIMCFNSTSTA